jgi:hypothetical protein
MRRAVRWGCTGVLAAVVWLGASVHARAAEGDVDATAESEQYVQQGIQLRRLGKNHDALEAFQHAYELHPTPRVSAQIGLARQALADWLGAERGIEEALRAADDPWIEQYRAVLEQGLATVRTHLATLYIDANVTGGEILIDGAPAEPLPSQGQAMRVVAGTLRIEVRAPGYVAVERPLEVAPQAQVHVVLTLDPLASAEPAAIVATTTPPAEGTEGSPIMNAARESKPTTVAVDSRRRTRGYFALGAAGVLAAAGVVAWRVQVLNADVYNDDSRCLHSGQTRGDQCAAYGTRANIALGLEIGAFAAASLSAGLGVWFLSTAPARSLRLSAICAPWTAGVLCTQRF